jgi:hypothetical protein
MAREIPLDQIGDYYRESIRILVAATTLEAERRLKEKTPVRVVYEGEPKGGGALRNAWRSDPKEGEVINNLEYAEPVVYGTNLPPSWKGEYRTRQNTVPGFPDLIAKELESWAQREYNKIANR